MYHGHISFITKWSLGNRGQTLYSKLCISILNDFLLHINGLMVTEKILEHFLCQHFFHHNIMQDFPVDFLLFLKPRLKSRKWGNIPLSSYQIKCLFLSLFIHSHSCLNPEPHRPKVKYKIVCLENICSMK